MDLPEDLLIIHQPVRLKVMTLLYRHGDIGFTEARTLLDLTPGNLDAHVKALAKADYADSRRALMKDRFEVRVMITPTGADAFERYLASLQRFLQNLE